MFCQLGQVTPEVSIAPGYDMIGGNAIGELEGSPFEHYSTSLGSVISPLIAVAAAVAGLPR